MTNLIRRSRARSRGLAGLAALAVLAAACGGNDPAASSTTAAPEVTSASSEPPATEAPVFTNAPTTTNPEIVATPGGTLTIALDGESTGFHPHVDAWANAGHNVAKAVFETLMAFDASGKPVPYLAESIEANDDATVWTITLRSGITFHNGEAFDAEAVKLNFESILASAQFKDQLALVASLNVVDELTLDVTMSQPWGTFPTVLTGDIGSQVGYMAAPAMLASPDGGRNPIGTGPFTFVEWIPDGQLTVAKNADYWQGPVYLDEVIFRPIPDPTSRKAAFDAGDVDLYYTGDSGDIVEYLAQQEAGDVNVTIGAPSSPDVVMFNTRSAPLDDVRVRRALVMAVDIPRLYDYLEATGVKRPLSGPYADDSFWFAESNYPEYDPAGAKALIDEYVAETGTPVEFEFAGNQSPFLVSYQELFQSMWSEIGATANIVSRAQSENVNAVIGGDFQVVLWGGIGGGDPDKDYQYFHSSGFNFSGFNTPTIDAAMDEGRRLSDPDARKEQYAIVQQELGDAVPYIWTGTNQFAVIAQSAVMGVAEFMLPGDVAGQPLTGGQLFLNGVWLMQ
ncbi:MAG: hypothetical protein RI958_2471 [Actinomycetota bacterium]|jgi:peptide/nickel transport system substrate-binding protein